MSYKARKQEKQYISLYAFLRRLKLHVFNYTIVTYGYVSIRRWDKHHSTQNEMAILIIYKFLYK